MTSDEVRVYLTEAIAGAFFNVAWKGDIAQRDFANADTEEQEIYRRRAVACLAVVETLHTPCSCGGLPHIVTLTDGCTFGLSNTTNWAVNDWTSCQHSPTVEWDPGTGEPDKWKRDQQVVSIEPHATCGGTGLSALLAFDEMRGIEQVGWRDARGKLERNNNGLSAGWTATPPIEPVYRFPVALLSPDTTETPS